MSKFSFILTTAALLCASTAFARHDIRDFGAIADTESDYAESLNSVALMKAFVAANYTDTISEREVYVPEGFTFYMQAI